MNIEMNDAERNLIKKALESHLSELRLEIVETKHDKTDLHKEEDQVKALITKIS